MNYLIWGTGTCAELFINQNWQDFFLKNNILAFIDNNKEKKGKKFFGKEIIHPSEIKNYSFDKIIICSSYETDILKQLVYDLQITKEFIITQDEWNHSLYDTLVEELDIYKKQLLIVGDEHLYSIFKSWYTDLLHVIGFVDLNDLSNILLYKFDYILLMNLMDIPDFHRESGKINIEKNLINLITQKYNVDSNKILTDSTFQLLRQIDRKVSWGTENPDKIFLVIQRSPIAGLGAYTYHTALNVAYALEHGYIPVVDMMSYKNQYLEDYEVGKINAWEKFFEQPAGYGLNDIKNSQNILFASTNRNLKKSNLFSFLKMKPELKQEVDQYIQTLFLKKQKILGVLFRGSDYSNRQPYGHEIQPDLDTLINKVKEKLVEWDNFDAIYLCTEIEDAVIHFKEEFEIPVYCYPQRRVSKKYKNYLIENVSDRKNDSYRRGADYWIALNALAQCDSLIGGMCGGTSVALALNNNQYKHTYVFNLGKYGITNNL